MVRRDDLEARGPFDEMRGGGIDGGHQAHLVDAAPEPRAAREVLTRHDRGRALGARREPHLDVREPGTAIARHDDQGCRAADDVDRCLEDHGRSERLGAGEEERSAPEEEDDRQQSAHQAIVRSTASRLRVIRWVAPQITCSPTG